MSPPHRPTISASSVEIISVAESKTSGLQKSEYAVFAIYFVLPSGVNLGLELGMVSDRVNNHILYH